MQVKYAEYFTDQVLRKRAYLKLSWIKKAITKPEYKEKQHDDRVRYWVYIRELGKYLRVITLADGKTVHNAFPDRNFKKKEGI